MKKNLTLLSLLFVFVFTNFTKAQAPAASPDVMLQAFYWDSYSDSKWTNLNAQAGELSQSFSLIWLPPSGYCGTTSSNMGYMPVYWFNQLSAFGTQDELKSLISNLKSLGTKSVADVVVNHRAGVAGWVDLATETYNGVTYTPNLSWICKTDECNTSGYPTTGANDTGDDFSGARDLDHTNTAVQSAINAYLQFLKNDIGYSGWRYDMTKGYTGNYTAMYNDAAGAYFSVGEYWDRSYDALYAWLQKASFKSTTFDFSFKYALNDWASSNDLTKLVWLYNGANQPAGLIHNPSTKRYGATFIDNHDTYRDANKFSGDVLMANAFMLCSPGIPCVFLPHWKTYKTQIQAMIAARKAAGINSESAVVVNQSSSTSYVATVTGTKGSLMIKLGSASYSVPSDYVLSTSGTNYAIYLKGVATAPVLTFSLSSGTYFSGQTLTLSATNSANIYYTTDGTTPTSSSTKYTSVITLPLGTTTFKAVAIDASNNSSSVISNTYVTIQKQSSIALGFKPPTAWGTSVYAYVWEVSSAGTVTQLSSAWPGTKISSANSYGYYVYNVSSFTQPTINVVFNIGSNSSQTVDLSTTQDVCWDYGALSGSKYSCTVNSSCGVTAVEKIKADEWKIYPNPTSGKLNFDVPESVNKVVITSTLGAKVGEMLLSNKQIDISSYPSGMYFVTIYDQNGVVATKPLMKR